MSNPATQVRPRDPLRNYQFHIYVESLVGPAVAVGGVQRLSGLGGAVGVYEVWEGGNNLHRYANPDRVTWDPVTLEQGLALDDTLEEWALGVRHFAMTGQLMAGKTGKVLVKRDVVIEAVDPVFQAPPGARSRARRFRLHNAWISKFNALPRMDAMAAEAALLLVELVHEGWTVEPAT
jgi:phage tail-like protein